MIIEVILLSAVAGMLLGALSFFVVSRNVEFAGVGISHSIFGGVAIAISLDLNVFLVSLIFGIVVGLLILKLSDGLEMNTSIGIFFPFSVALGIVVLYVLHKQPMDIWSYLFGNIFLLSNSEKLMLVLFSLIVGVYSFLFLEKQVFVSLDRELARAYGIEVELHDHAFFLLLSVGIVVAIKSVGIILLSALLVIPSAIAFMLSKGIIPSFVMSVFLGGAIMCLGSFLAYVFNVPSGAGTVLLGSLLYFLSKLVWIYRN